MCIFFVVYPSSNQKTLLSPSARSLNCSLIILHLGHPPPLVTGHGDFCRRVSSLKLNLHDRAPIFNSTKLTGPHNERRAIYRQVGASSTFLKDFEAGLTGTNLQFPTSSHNDVHRERVAHLKGLQSVNMSYASDRALMKAIWTIMNSSTSMCSDLAQLCHTETRMADAKAILTRAASDLRSRGGHKARHASQELSAATANLALTLSTLVQRVNGIANVIHTLSVVIGTLESHLHQGALTNFSTQLLAPLRDAENLGLREVADVTNTTTRAFTATIIAVSEQASRMNDTITSTAINEAASVIKAEMQRALDTVSIHSLTLIFIHYDSMFIVTYTLNSYEFGFK